MVDDGSSMHSAKGMRRILRAVRRAAEQARDEDRVGRRDSTSNRRGRKGEMGKKRKRDTEKTMQRGHFAPRIALASQHNNSSLSSKDLSCSVSAPFGTPDGYRLQ